MNSARTAFPDLRTTLAVRFAPESFLDTVYLMVSLRTALVSATSTNVSHSASVEASYVWSVLTAMLTSPPSGETVITSSVFTVNLPSVKESVRTFTRPVALSIAYTSMQPAAKRILAASTAASSASAGIEGAVIVSVFSPTLTFQPSEAYARTTGSVAPETTKPTSTSAPITIGTSFSRRVRVKFC